MNEYLQEYSKWTRPELGNEWFALSTEEQDKLIRKSVSSFSARHDLTRKFSWAVPTEEALDTIAKYSPIIEIGAGTGYWAHLLSQRGVVIHPYDQYPPDGTDFPEGEYDNYADKSWYHRGAFPYTHVRKGNQRKLKGYKSNWNLFLCWPPMSNMAVQSLIYHRGRYVIYIGESRWGCNADEAFFDRLDKFYTHVEGVSIPQWDGLHDYLDIYERKV